MGSCGVRVRFFLLSPNAALSPSFRELFDRDANLDANFRRLREEGVKPSRAFEPTLEVGPGPCHRQFGLQYVSAESRFRGTGDEAETPGKSERRIYLHRPSLRASRPTIQHL